MKNLPFVLAIFLACCWSCTTQVLTGEVSRGGHQVLVVPGTTTMASLGFEADGVEVKLLRVLFQGEIHTEASAFRVPKKEGLMHSDYEFGFVDIHMKGTTIRLDATNNFLQLLPGDKTKNVQSMDATLYGQDGSFVARVKFPFIPRN